ncbi:MAG: hypothetical protein ACRC7N_07580, partial [Clostridium sp.]
TNKGVTNHQQGNNKQATTNKNEKNEKNNNNVYKEETHKKEVSVDVNDIYNAYRDSGFGELDSEAKDRINKNILGFSKKWILEAFDIAEFNSCFSLSYVERILNDWKTKEQRKSYKNLERDNKTKWEEDYDDEFRKNSRRGFSAGW